MKQIGSTATIIPPTAGKHSPPCPKSKDGKHDWMYSGMANIYFCTLCSATEERK